MAQATLAKTLQQGVRPAPIPRHIALMKCALVGAAFDKEGWLFEPKLDGLRVICTFDGSEWTLLSRNDKPQNFQFPEIVTGLKRSVIKPAVLDGEIVCLDEHGRSSFRLLQQRFHLTTEPLVKARMAKFPAEIFLFDILCFDKFDLRKLPLVDRKKILKAAVKWKSPMRETPVTLNKGIKLFEKACRHGEEGIIAKRASSTYTGDRSGSWLKIKCSGRQEFVIGGYTDPQGTRIGFGALLVGYYDEQGKLRFAGKVGTGFDSKMLADLYKRLKAIEIDKNLFANGAGREPRAHFVEPKLVAEIEYSEWTQNHMLRQPRFQGLREDKDARSVRREKAAHVVGAPRIQHAADPDLGGNGNPHPRRLRVSGSTSSKSRASASAKPQAGKTTSRVNFTHVDKIMFPDAGLTKGDLLNYYARISSHLLPYLKDRPITVERLPDGINGPRFWQKNTPPYYPSWIKRIELPTESGKRVQYSLVNDLDTLLFFVNQGAITFHVYMSRIRKLDRPDYVLYDLDPSASTFANVVTIAKKIHETLKKAKIDCYAKTSGKSGLHVLVPWLGHTPYDEAREWALHIANEVCAALPKIATTERLIAARGKRVYVDVMQNALGKHVVPPYVIRTIPEATVSTPLEWRELTARLNPKKFTVAAVLKRFARRNDSLAELVE